MAIIASRALKFSNPINFNDVFDCTLHNIYFDMNEIGFHAAKDIERLHNEFPTLKKNLDHLPKAFKYAAESA